MVKKYHDDPVACKQFFKYQNVKKQDRNKVVVLIKLIVIRNIL
jgi:hypothetical protein